MSDIIGTVTIDGSPLQNAKITAINDTQGIVESTATIAADESTLAHSQVGTPPTS